jgi:AcrR family transcriptional regulator
LNDGAVPAVSSEQPGTREQSRPVPSRRAFGKARVHASLLQAARTQFARRGVAATTMDDLARLAGVSRATAFNYFPSKNLLLQALVREMEARFLHVIESQFARPASAAERISALFRWTAQGIAETPQLSRVLIGASETTFGAARDSGVRTQRVHRALMQVLAAGRREGNVRDDLSTEILAEIVGGSYVGILHAWRVTARYPLGRRLEEAAGALSQLISVAPPAPRRGRAR